MWVSAPDPDRLDQLRTAAGVSETGTPAALDQTEDRQNPHRISSGGGVFFALGALVYRIAQNTYFAHFAQIAQIEQKPEK